MLRGMNLLNLIVFLQATSGFRATAEQQLLAQPSIYCYASLETLSNDVPVHANCFEVTSSGSISRVFVGSEKQNESAGHAYPGLWDGHGHLMNYGELLKSVTLFGSADLNEALTRVKTYAQGNPHAGGETEWLRGVGWDQAAFGRMPTAADLDTISELQGKYIMLDRVDVHCIWVSPAVLDLLPSPFPHVPGGDVITEPGPGVFCDNAMDLIMQKWPKPSKAKKTEFVKAAHQSLVSLGLVGMHDAGVAPQDLELYNELAEKGDWIVRMYAMRECSQRNTFCGNELAQVDRADGMLMVKSVKLFADGALGSWGSAMIDPYSDKPSTNGSLLISASTLTDLTREWSLAGYQVNIHAIGDLANRYAIDAFEAALKELCPTTSLKECQSKHRFRIEHSQIMHPDDQERVFQMGIIPSIQPTHATSDMSYAEDRLGAKRTNEEAYRMHSFLPLHPVLGSDFPVEPPNPFEGFFAAIARRSPRTGLDRDGKTVGWHMEEALSLADALRGFTINPARGAFLEGKAGVLIPGAFADWIVLDERLEDLSVDEIRNVKVRETWIAGKCVYRRQDGATAGTKDEL